MPAAEELLYQYEALTLHQANEAETRLKLIDRIIFDVLGWTREDVHVEARVSEDGSTTFADYTVRTAGVSFVVEAKKVGETFFDVPNVRKRRLSDSFVSGPIGEAIKQARDYCRKLSIPFAAVTNGSEWIVFPASRVDQISFRMSSAIIFPSLKSILGEDKDEFLHLLSRDAVVSGSLETELLGRVDDQFGDRRLRFHFSNRGVKHSSDPLFPLIKHAVVSAFTDSIVDTDPDLLRKCYVTTADRRKYDQQISMYISKRTPVVMKPMRPMGKKDAGSLKQILSTAKTQVRPLAMLVIGPVGAGKTTFFNYTRLVTSARIFEQTKGQAYPHWIYIDFRDYTPNVSPADFIYRQIRDYMTADLFFCSYDQCIRPAYAERIRALRQGPLSLIANNEERIQEKIADYLLEQADRDDYTDNLLRYATSKVPVFLVIDNVDQLDQDEKQSSVFTEAMSIAHKNRLNLAIAIRDATYIRHKSSAAFDAFDFTPFYVEPPQIKAVLSKRFFLMRELLKGESGEFVSEGGARVTIGDLSTVADLVNRSVLGTQVGDVIDVLSTSDVRLALRMTREFLESGYSNPGRAIQTYERTGDYVLPKHEALRSVLLGRQPVYSEEFSIIGNPFDSHQSRTKHQLLRLYILNALVAMASNQRFQQVEGEAIANSLEKLGYGRESTAEVLSDLCQLRFTHTAAHGIATLSTSFHPSRLGGYVVRNLMADPTYLEAVLMDTFIADVEIWHQLRELSEQIDAQRGDVVGRLRLRHERIRVFFAYMHAMYEEILVEARRRALAAEWVSDPFDAIDRLLTRNLAKAMRSATKNYGSDSARAAAGL